MRSMFSFSMAVMRADLFRGSMQLMFSCSGWPLYFSSRLKYHDQSHLSHCSITQIRECQWPFLDMIPQISVRVTIIQLLNWTVTVCNGDHGEGCWKEWGEAGKIWVRKAMLGILSVNFSHDKVHYQKHNLCILFVGRYVNAGTESGRNMH
jgi:hypothetical protein